MSSIVENRERVGRFTSSQIYKLMKRGRGVNDVFSKAGLTYIESKYHERKLNRSLDMSAYSRSMAWGQFLEMYVYSHFAGMRYEISSNETKINPNIPYHAGSTDLRIPDLLVSDIKAYEPTKFCKMVECFLKLDRAIFREEFDQEYWQLVSNAAIDGVTRAESIVYMPTLDDLQEIKDAAQGFDGPDQWKYKFISDSEDYQLPHIPEGSEYESINRFEFEIPQEDFDFMTDRLKLAEEELQNHYKKTA